MEKLLIGEVIYNLRKEKEITQEQLAGFIGVSAAAVSKWESGSSYPDITLLPTLATFFHVSVDRLLNFKIELTDEECMQLFSECEKLFSSNKLEQAMNKCNEYLEKYPRSYYLKFRIAFLKNMYAWKWMDEDKCKEIIAQAIKLYEDIVDNCSKTDLVEQASFQLGALYPTTGGGGAEKAIEVLSKLKKNRLDPDMLLADIYITQNEIKKAREIQQSSLFRNIFEASMTCLGLANSYMKENRDLKMIERYYELSLNLKKAVELDTCMNGADGDCDGDGDADIFKDSSNSCGKSLSFAMEYLNLAQVYLEFEKSDLAIETLKKMVADLRRNDINKPENFKLIWCFSEIPASKRTITMNLYENIQTILSQPLFDVIRDYEEFKNMMDEINKMY